MMQHNMTLIAIIWSRFILSHWQIDSLGWCTCPDLISCILTCIVVTLLALHSSPTLPPWLTVLLWPWRSYAGPRVCQRVAVQWSGRAQREERSSQRAGENHLPNARTHLKKAHNIIMKWKYSPCICVQTLCCIMYSGASLYPLRGYSACCLWCQIKSL